MLQNSYCSLIEELYSQILVSNAELEDDDRYHLLKFQTFIMQVCRLQAYKHKPVKINISQIGVSLQFNAFDFLFSSLYRRLT